MALPHRKSVVYNLTIPSNKTKVKYRPFLVKDEKSLLLAQQSEDADVMLDTLKDIIKSCIQTNIDVDSLAIFDIEYIFTQIRAKSVGEEVELLFRCQHCTDEKATVKIKFDLTNINITFDPKHNKKIPLFDDVGIVLKYPNIDIIKKIDGLNLNDIDTLFDIVIECIDYIYDSEELYYAKEQTRKELEEFLNNLDSEQFLKIQEFFETMPKMMQEVNYTCPVCNASNHMVLEGLESFF